MAVFAPSRAAMTHWLAPFPPNPIENLSPCSVSPTFGIRGTLLYKHTTKIQKKTSLTSQFIKTKVNS